MLNNLTGWHFLIILVVVLLLFGAPKLPGLARSLGQSMKIFKAEIKPEKTEGDSTVVDSTPVVTDETSRTTGSADSSTKP